MNLAISLIIGNVAMLLGELHFVQDDQHLCTRTVIGWIISYFYTASAFLLACESHACFKVKRSIMHVKWQFLLPLLVGAGVGGIRFGDYSWTNLQFSWALWQWSSWHVILLLQQKENPASRGVELHLLRIDSNGCLLLHHMGFWAPSLHSVPRLGYSGLLPCVPGFAPPFELLSSFISHV